MVYTVDINLQGGYSSILYVNFHSKMQKNRACVSTGESARFSNYDWTEKPERSRPNNFFLIEISIFFEVVEM